MNDVKPWYQSKTIWSNVIIGMLGLYMNLISSGAHLPDIPGWVITLLSAFGIYGRVTATRMIGSYPK